MREMNKEERKKEEEKGDIHSLDYSERLKFLNELPNSEHIVKAENRIVDNAEDLRNAVVLFSSREGSEGSYLKRYDFPYELDGKSVLNLKYKNTFSIDAKVIEVHEVKDTNTFNYLCAIEDGKAKDEQLYQDALNEYKQKYVDWEAIRELASKILSGDVDAFVEAIRQADPFSEISQLGSSVELKSDGSNLIEATLRVNGEDVIPNEMKTLLKSGKHSVKKMTKTRFYELYQDYVCGGALRVAREIFTLLPIEMTIVTAVGELLNTKTGYMEEQPILSVAIPRDTLNRLNFAMLDPSDSMDNFLHKMKFLKTKGFQKVDKILVSALDSL